jgi:NAD(P)-dependent dehydrogenase (short-subunit alcohol dehydrogenase family)
MGWSARDIPDQSGRTAVVTGANSGIGYRTASELARHGARVLLACRNERRGQQAAERMRAEVPGARIGYRHLDLADLASVRAFAAEFAADGARGGGDAEAPARLDLLINNAGVMALPLSRTADGFETQFGVNHLGHFALTGLLLPHLLATPGSRIVTVSSALHALATVDPRDPDCEHGYHKWTAYARSKSANLMFTHELARRLAAAGSDTVAAAAHPGYADTNLQTAGPRLAGDRRAERVVGLGNRLLAQPAAAGALPTLYAATAPDVAPDSFTGPGRLGWRGTPAPAWRMPWTRDDRATRVLWDLSERKTGVGYDLDAA